MSSSGNLKNEGSFDQDSIPMELFLDQASPEMLSSKSVQKKKGTFSGSPLCFSSLASSFLECLVVYVVEPYASLYLVRVYDVVELLQLLEDFLVFAVLPYQEKERVVCECVIMVVYEFGYDSLRTEIFKHP